MADEGLRIVNSVDNTQVDESFARMRKEIINSATTAQNEGKKIDHAFERVALSVNATSDTIKKKIYEASQNVNELTAKIIEQKGVVKDVQADVKRLSDAYKAAKKSGSFGTSGLLSELNAAKKALDEEKNALFSLNQEKARASLRVKELRGQLELTNKATKDNIASVRLLAKGLTALGGAAAVKAFIQKVVETRGEFQQLEVSFTTMLGSAEKANALMQQLTKTAAITPFDLKGVTDGAKQLLAYGVAADEVNDVLIHLGDIAAGLSLPLGDLVYLYGTTMTQGRMFTQDLRQFMGRGIPLAEELAKQFGVTKDKVGELVTAGKVGANEFKAAIMAMSSEGGKFGGLMEAQSKTITGQISNIEDAIDVAFNNFGKQSEGAINTALSGVTFLVENYEKVGKIILSVAGVYGTYKAAVLAVIAVEKIMAAARLAQIKQTTLIQLATDVLTKKMALLNATMLANPWVLAATAIAGVVAVMVNMETQTERLQRVSDEYDKQKEEAIRKEEEHANKINELIQIAGDESLSTDARRKALVLLEQQYPQIFSKYDTEYEKLANILKIKEEIAILDGQKSIKNPVNEQAQIDARIAELEKKGASSSYMINGQVIRHGRTTDEETELTDLKKRRDELSRQIERDKGNAYMANLTGVTNEDLQAQIQERKNILASIKIKQQQNDKIKYSGRVTKGGATGVFTPDEIQGQLQILESEQNRRNAKTYTPAELKAQAAKTLADAKKALVDFDKSSNKMSIEEAEKERKRLEEAVKDAEKKYKALGGDTSKGGKKTDTKAKDEADISKRILQITQQTELDEINQKKDGVEKRLALAEYEHKKELAQLDKTHEEIVAKRGGNLTEEEEATFSQARELAERKHQKAVGQIMIEEKEARTNAILDYLEDYGSFEDQRLAVEIRYNKLILAEKDKWLKQSLEHEKQAILQEIEYNELIAKSRRVSDFTSATGSFGKLAGGIASNLVKYSKSDGFKSLSDEQQKQVFKMIDDLNADTGKGGASMKTVNQKMGEYAVALEVLAQQTKLQAEASQRNFEAQTALHNADVELAQAESELANALNGGDLSLIQSAQAKVNVAKTNQATAQGNAAQAETEYANAITATANARTEANKCEASAQQANRKFAESVELVGDISSAVASKSMTQLWNALKPLIFKSKDVRNITDLSGGIKEIVDTANDVDMTEIAATLKSGLSSILDNISNIDNLEGVKEKVQDIISNAFEGASADDSLINKVQNQLGDVFTRLIDGISGGTGNAADLIKDASDELGDIIGNLAKGGESSGNIWGIIIGVILQLLEEFGKNGIGTFIGELLNNIGDAIAGLLGNIFSADLEKNVIAQIIEGVGNIIAGIIEGIGNLFTGGMLGDFLGVHGNMEEMDKTIDSLTTQNKVLADVMSKLEETIRKSSLFDIEDDYEKMLELLKKQEQNEKDKIDAEGAKWESGSHSVNYHLGKNGTWQSLMRTVGKMYGIDVTGGGGSFFNNISAEQLYDLKYNNTDLYNQILSTIRGEENSHTGSGIADMLDEMTENFGDAAKRVKDIFNENLTGISVDSVKSDISSMLADVTKKTSDWAENLEDSLRNSVVNGLMREMDKDIDEWYQSYADAMKDGLTKEEADALRAAYQQITNEAIAERDDAFNKLGLNNSEYKQEASSKGWQSLSQDEGEEMNGRMTAIEIAAYDIKDLNVTRNDIMIRLEQGQGGIKATVGAVQDAIAMSNIHLSDIAKYTKHLVGIGDKLDSIIDNTKHL